MTCTVSITVSTETAAKLIANSAIGMFPDAAVTLRAGEGEVESYIRRGVCVSLDCKCVAAGIEGHDLSRSTSGNLSSPNPNEMCWCGHPRDSHSVTHWSNPGHQVCDVDDCLCASFGSDKV